MKLPTPEQVRARIRARRTVEVVTAAHGQRYATFHCEKCKAVHVHLAGRTDEGPVEDFLGPRSAHCGDGSTYYLTLARAAPR